MDVVYFGLLAAGMGAMWWQHVRRVRRMPRLGTRFEESADIALHVARHAASSRGFDVSTTCILYGLLQDDTIVSAIRECGGDPDRIEDRVLEELEAPGDHYDVAPIVGWLLRVAAHQDRRVTCTDLWGGLAQHAPETIDLVGTGGVSSAEVLFVLVHGIAEKDVPWPPGDTVSVVLINDDVSTQELVVDVLCKVFGRDEDEATELMLRVHHEGRGVIGDINATTAKRQVGEARKRARLAGYPLWIKAERTPPGATSLP